MHSWAGEAAGPPVADITLGLTGWPHTVPSTVPRGGEGPGTFLVPTNLIFQLFSVTL